MNAENRPIRRLPNNNIVPKKANRHPGGSYLLRSIPCDDESCGTVLGWPDAHLCEDCAGALEQQGIATPDEQLTLEEAST